MPAPVVAPYGTWKSPITADLITGATIGLGSPVADGDTLYWLESRPSEAGRSVLVRRDADGTVADVTPPPFNVRSRVHEYGGGAFAVAGGCVVFVDFPGQRLYRIDAGRAPRALTPETKGVLRFADVDLDLGRNRAICVREDHRGGGEPVNALVSLDMAGDEAGGTVIASGHDFYACPRLSPDGRQLAWLTWDHPDMPWDGSDLWVADVAADGSLGQPRHIAGGRDIAVFQSAWATDGTLHFVADPTGWWNIFAWRNGTAVNQCPRDAEFGLPLWQFGAATYAFLPDGRIVCRRIEAGQARLALLENGRLLDIETPFVSLGAPCPFAGRVALTAAGASEPTRLVLLDPNSGTVETLRRSASVDIEPGYVSAAQAIEFPTTGGRTAHAYYYPPANKDFRAPEGEAPPLIVRSHGGPTGATDPGFSPAIQYWTSRGFAVADVNYGGSTGYGRAYRQRLDGQWGVVDVDDCANAALFLAGRGLADRQRLIIRGGSAGGYTTLAALAFRHVFRAGASLYGIGDLTALAHDTHKFESRYLDRLIGPLPAAAAVYAERSPLVHAEGLDCPVIFFQGLDDKVVPPNQAEAMVAALDAKGIPVAYVPFEGEGHGFRKAENIKRAIESELEFYGRVFGFIPADRLEPVTIRNL